MFSLKIRNYSFENLKSSPKYLKTDNTDKISDLITVNIGFTQLNVQNCSNKFQKFGTSKLGKLSDDEELNIISSSFTHFLHWVNFSDSITDY